MNIYDIAREAGVSIATISRVTNGKSVVSSKTREKVEAILKKYNYTPDPTARSLVAKSTKSVAILADDIREPYYSGVAYAVVRGLSDLDFASILCDTGGTAQGVKRGLQTALSRRADAAVILGMSFEAEATVLNFNQSMPIVLINNFIDAQGIYSVMCDESYGMMLAVSKLAAIGRRHIILIQDGDGYSGNKLSEGFESGMAMNDLASEKQMFTTERGAEGGYACAEALLRDGRSFNGVVCGDDSTAAGFTKCLIKNSVHVPQDVSVIGFHNTPVAECCSPALTTIDCRSDKVGAATANLLSELFENRLTERKAVILPRLVRRESA